MSLPSSLAFLLPSSPLPPWPSHVWSAVFSVSLCFCLRFFLVQVLPCDPLMVLSLWLLCLSPCLLGFPCISQYSCHTSISAAMPQPCLHTILNHVFLSEDALPPGKTELDFSTGDPRILSSKSLTIWKAQADRAGTFLPLSPLKPTLLSLLAPHLLCAGCQSCLGCPGRADRVKQLLGESLFGLAPPPRSAYPLCAQPPVHHTVTKKVYG